MHQRGNEKELHSGDKSDAIRPVHKYASRNSECIYRTRVNAYLFLSFSLSVCLFWQIICMLSRYSSSLTIFHWWKGDQQSWLVHLNLKRLAKDLHFVHSNNAEWDSGGACLANQRKSAELDKCSPFSCWPRKERRKWQRKLGHSY